MRFIKDEEFLRGKCPMTKEEIRMLSIGKMNLEEDSTVLDVGSGTGSITIQSAVISFKGTVYSIEKEEEACNVVKSNIEKFKCNNIKLIKNDAYSALTELESKKLRFDSIFIGGSSGQLKDIIIKCDSMLKEEGTIVLNFITLDNAYKAVEILKELKYDFDISLVNVSKNRGNTLMMTALNPIYIIQGCKSLFAL
ncbi:precorrin-6Y C5,15-methyltransferase (decarboxylating) subunit CbiT [uncultured Clostridium sp.]|uniref:precorrin-6Y C5,15-methyltransferase (decarboxylating) subunit CbiT n=1 Tax=uncultured Clostridium sp. TaxID=59620 RepID=UPI0025E990A4|nr:precorrin-6Y C5,15-methyltransferase (decarboxylating) subunit CbiT [uncultured Clostridium sp.]